MRVNGLYGHIRSNDVRSLALFAGFVAALQFLAMLALFVPLAMHDPDHAPLYGWTGYLVRWVPIVTVIGALLFAVQMAWHVRTVRRRTDFRFVDDHDEPRLCRIVEPLTIAAGLPTPYVGVIDSPALNAFACGIRQKDAVLVFTRGLVDGLDDDELAAVAAHEIVHIVNGDIRLIAATNVWLDTLRLLQPRPSADRTKRIWQACPSDPGRGAADDGRARPRRDASATACGRRKPSYASHDRVGTRIHRRCGIRSAHAEPCGARFSAPPDRGAERHSRTRCRTGRDDDRRGVQRRLRDASDHRRADRGDHLRHRLDGADRAGAPRYAVPRVAR
jgi:hypothetical protein